MLGRLLSFSEGLFFEAYKRYINSWLLGPFTLHQPYEFHASESPKATNEATTVKILNNLQQGFLTKTSAGCWSPNLPEPKITKVLMRQENPPIPRLAFFQATSVPWLKQSHVEPRPRAIGGTESIFHEFSTCKALRWTLGKDPHTIHETNGIFTYMNGWFFMVNVGEYSIDGCYGINI